MIWLWVWCFNLFHNKTFEWKLYISIQSKVISEVLSIINNAMGRLVAVEFSVKNKCSNLEHESIFLGNNHSKLIHTYELSMINDNECWQQLLDNRTLMSGIWMFNYWYLQLGRPPCKVTIRKTEIFQEYKHKYIPSNDYDYYYFMKRKVLLLLPHSFNGLCENL